uniref:Uncharacterized protein n=1 Tax=Arion vulgaris TaxID=1028688 RepID=A0A0B7ASZ4_9EUPU
MHTRYFRFLLCISVCSCLSTKFTTLVWFVAKMTGLTEYRKDTFNFQHYCMHYIQPLDYIKPNKKILPSVHNTLYTSLPQLQKTCRFGIGSSRVKTCSPGLKKINPTGHKFV